jgi:adenylate cyclase
VIGTKRLEFTVIGDAVNVAQRLESLAKGTGCSLIATETILKEAAFDLSKMPSWQAFANLPLRGRAEVMTVYGRV